MGKIGYIRVSTEHQETARQEALMQQYQVERVFAEKMSGKNADRPELKAMLEYVREGDTLYIESISRLGRSTRDLLNIIDVLQKKGVTLVSSKENIDTNTPQGRFVLSIFAALSELEREQTLQRQREGIAISKSQGKYKGRQPIAIDWDKFSQLYELWKAEEITAVEFRQRMIPIDLGSLRGCETLPDKKRAIYSVLRAATGPIDKGTSRKLKGFLSDYLKDKEYLVSLNNLCSELVKTGGFGAEIADCVQSVLDDINEVGYEEQTWDDLFLQGRKIIVINLGNEVGDSNHQLLDMLVGSLFNWQMSHDSGFLSIAIDELIDQDFSTGSPLQTIVKQGRKFHTALIGATQDYYNQGSSHLDTMKQANIKSFCRPGKSEDRVAQKLGYSNAVDAGFNKFKAGDTILEFDGYNKETGENEALTLKGRVVDFIETPLYEKFKEIYGC